MGASAPRLNMDKPGHGEQRIEGFMNRAAASKYHNNIRTVSDAGRRRQIAENY